MKIPTTAAIRVLRANKVDFEAHVYKYEARGGTAVSARELGVPEAHVIKTLIMEDEKRQPLVVLMSGDKEVSVKNLARHLGVKTIKPCAPDVAQKHSGYQVGGTSPFGTRKTMPIYADPCVFEPERIYINGGKRGLLVSIAPGVLEQVLKAEKVACSG